MNEYKPVSHWCDCCGAEIDDTQEVFVVDNGKVYCEECFKDYIIDNLDVYEIAELWNIPVRMAVEV